MLTSSPSSLEELRDLDEKRKALIPQTFINGQNPDGMNGLATTPIKEPTPPPVPSSPDSEADSDDEGAPTRKGRSLRSKRVSANEKKRKREEEAAAKKEKKAKEAAAKKEKASGPAAQILKIEKEMERVREKIRESEDNVAETDSDLRETNCQRTKCLGKDRFCNRYYWFERNGMPYAGLPDSSTVDRGYANARVWVQGPDQMEKEGFIDLDGEMKAKYKSFMGMTVVERRQEEGGETILEDAREWGYIDDPLVLDQLMGWLDDRGIREKSLRKELQLWRDQIASCMDKFADWCEKQEAKRMERMEARDTAVRTRHGEKEKTADRDMMRHPCLSWSNTWAMHELEHIHSKPPKPKAKKGKGGKKVAFASEGRASRSKAK